MLPLFISGSEITLTIYIDILFLNNTLMSISILWALGKILNLQIKWLKLMYATLFANIYTFFIIYLKVNNFGTSIFFQLILNITAASTMIYLSFNIKNLRKFLKTLGTLYLITFVTIGASLSFFYIYGINPFKAGCLVSGTIFLWIIGKYGWRFMKNNTNPEELFVNVTVFIDDNNITVKGLVDTGNRLYDPMSQMSVIIIELNQFKVFFSDELQNKIVKNRGGILEQVSLISEYDWENRIRVLPYNVIGQDNGMLLGFRPDQVSIEYADDNLTLESIIIGITDESLDYNGEYHALINPEILN